MFQTVRRFQSSRSAKGGISTSATSFRDHSSGPRQESGATMGSGASGGHHSNNDAEQLSCWQAAKEHLKRELWSYVGLLGVFCVYFGILVCVYALKGVFAQRWIMTCCGVFLTGVGGVNLFASWMCYLHQKKHRRFSSCFGGESDDQDQDGDQDQDQDQPAPSSAPDKPPREKTRPRGHSLAGFLTPEFAKYAEFSARDRRYDSKRYHFFRAYDPTQISISFAHK